MAARDPRVDAYIAKSAEFARPILTHLREVVHAACPDVEETMKWSFPHFEYKGMLVRHGRVQGALRLRLLEELAVVGKGGEAEKAMGQFGRITKLSDLPSKKVLTGYIKKAMKLNEAGVKSPTRSKPKAPKPELPVPDDLAAALALNDAGPGHLRRSSAPATSANTSSGSPRRRPRPRAPVGSRRPSSGWPRASRGTGNT